MKKIIKWWVSIPAKVRRLCQPEVLEVAFEGAVSSPPPDRSLRTKPVLLVQCVEDIYYYGLFGKICSALKQRHEIRVDQFVLRSANMSESVSMRKFLFFRLVINQLQNIKWIRLYCAFCDEVAYRCSDLSSPLGDALSLIRARTIWKTLSDRTALTNLEIDGIFVGDLVSDTFIRFKPEATVDLSDKYLMIVIWQAICDIRRAEKYFSQVKPAIFLTSYSTYVQHGVAVRVALRNGVRVFSFGNFQQLWKELLPGDWMHTRDPINYARGFSLLENQEEKLAMAEAALAFRLNGGIDQATTYMRQSAYRETDVMTIDARGAVIVFLHDFFDSPNGYYDMVFPDFWEWIVFTIRTLEENGIRFLIKPHPNQIELSDETLKKLKGRFPGANFVSQNITNKQLVNGGAVCAVTAFGTVAHEMAYLGIPTIACARHPHVSFDFCVTARSRAEYAEALLSAPTLQLNKAEMRRQSLCFYYMHNLDLSPDDMQLRNALLAFRSRCSKADMSVADKQLTDELDKLAELPAFQTMAENLGRRLPAIAA